MCNYCRKFTQSAYKLRSGAEITVPCTGEAFIDLFDNFIIHIDAYVTDLEAAIPIKYCPWCGRALKEKLNRNIGEKINENTSAPARNK